MNTKSKIFLVISMLLSSSVLCILVYLLYSSSRSTTTPTVSTVSLVDSIKSSIPTTTEKPITTTPASITSTPVPQVPDCAPHWANSNTGGYNCNDNSKCIKNKKLFNGAWGCDTDNKFYYNIDTNMNTGGCKKDWTDGHTQSYLCQSNDICKLKKSQLYGAWGCDGDAKLYHSI